MKFYRILLAVILSILLLLALYFKNNTDTVFANIGDYYYKHNNIVEAQKFYEKSFILGNTNPRTREAYVNSIIMSPLTVEAQEKLVSIVESDVTDKASNVAKSFLIELRNKIFEKYNENYIKQAPYNQKIVRWNHFPITYSFVDTNDVPTYYLTEIRQAFLDWEREGDLMFSEISGNANINIKFFKMPNYFKLKSGAKYVLAYTVPNISSNHLESMDIIFYVKNIDNSYFTKNQIYNTSLHEIFHAVGFMGHSFNKDDIMYYSKDNTLYNDARATLSESDIKTQKLLYKIKPDITSDNELKSEYIPYIILGDNDELTDSKIQEAKKYIKSAPNLPAGYIDLADTYVAKKKYPEAIRSLEKALQVASTNEMKQVVYYNLAVSYYYIDHSDMALKYLTYAQEIMDSLDIHYLKAEILKNKNPKLAEKEYIYLMNQKPTRVEYALSLINFYAKNKSYYKARKIMKKFVKNNPEYKNDKRFKAYGILAF